MLKQPLHVHTAGRRPESLSQPLTQSQRAPEPAVPGNGTVEQRATEHPLRARARPAGAWKLIIPVLLAAGAAAGWWATHRAPVEIYLTAPVTRGTIARTIIATGTVNPVLTIIVGSYVSGVIQNVYCDYNSRVRKGQLCATIDPRPYQAALDQAKGQMARDSAQLAGARLDLSRYAVLWKENSVAKQTYDDQDALVKELQGAVQLDQAALENAQVNLGYTRIVSPVDGTVIARNVTIGQTVAASFQTPTLFLIATDLTKMQVDTNVSESDIGAVKDGNPVNFTVEAFTDRIFHGTVVQVRQAPQSVQNVITYDVVVGVDNHDGLLKPGMTATAAIISAQHTGVLRVPDQALRFVPGGLRAGAHPAVPATSAAGIATAVGAGTSAGASAKVWTLRAGQLRPVSITPGLDDDTYTEVVSGDLRAGDEVVVGEQRTPASRSTPLRFGL